MLVQPNGSYWLMCDETRVMDLSSFGGVAGAQVTGTVVQHLDQAGSLVFEWSPFDHFEITDVDLETRSGPTVNWTHGNAIDLDAKGNLLISFRSLSEVTKIDTKTGEVLWRMGGLRNQFTFADPEPPFLGQHGVRAATEELVLLDNFGQAPGSRAERYALDEVGHTARLTTVYAPSAATRAALGGTTQDLPGRHTLVAFGDGAVVQEYDSAGSVVWQIDGNPGYIFRAQRIQLSIPSGDRPGAVGCGRGEVPAPPHESWASNPSSAPRSRTRSSPIALSETLPTESRNHPASPWKPKAPNGTAARPARSSR